jgi:PBSX family phage terminase large subunit
MNLSPKQLEAYRSTRDSQLNLLVGSVRSGKTYISYYLILRKFLELIQTHSEGEILFIGKTVATVYRNIAVPMMNLFGDSVKVIRGINEIRIFGRTAYMLGADDAKAEEKLRGMTVAFAVGDEVTLWPESVFSMLLTRLSLPQSQFIGTTNPDSPFHWLKKEFINRADEVGMNVIKFQLEDNHTLTQEYKDGLKARIRGFWYRRLVLGEWCVAEGQIYDQFDAKVNVFPNDGMGHIPSSPPIDLYVSCDYGTGTTTVFGFWWRTADDKFYLLREWRYSPSEVKPQKSDLEFVDALIDFLHQCQRAELIGEKVDFLRIPIIVDKYAASFIRQLELSGFRFALRCNNDVINGIREVNNGFHARKLFIHESCEGLIDEISSYSWDSKKQIKGEDAPVKRNDHSVDMMRYGYYTLIEPQTRGRKLVYRT